MYQQRLVSVLNVIAACLVISVAVEAARRESIESRSSECNVDAIARKSATIATKEILEQIVSASFPKLAHVRISIKTFTSRTTYFKTRFAVPDRLFNTLTIILEVNPCVFSMGAPIDGVIAILAHELAHAAYYHRKNLFQLIGLFRLICPSANVGFERRADLVAIFLGYGRGLAEYRKWLFDNISASESASKKRIYFSPEEIRILTPIVENRPNEFNTLLRRIPRNLNEVQSWARTMNAN
jgi:hypothetical protein